MVLLIKFLVKKECYLNCSRLTLWLFYIFISICIIPFMIPESAHATQMHNAAEGVVVHQIGHLFFLISMVILYFTIRGKSLDSQKGWRFIQISALLFVLWNLDALIVHFLDNQIELISPVPLSIWEIKIDVMDPSINIDSSRHITWLYYLLRLDHLLSLPAMVFLWRGLVLINEHDISIKGNVEETL